MQRTYRFKVTVCAGLAASLISGLSAGEAQVSFAPPERLQIPELTELEGPEVVDFDGDGVKDLLSGNYAGNLIFRKNTGSNDEPSYAKPVAARKFLHIPLLQRNTHRTIAHKRESNLAHLL